MALLTWVESYSLMLHCQVGVGDDVYVFGGKEVPRRRALDIAYKLDLNTGKWRALPARLPTARNGPFCGLAEKQGKPYIVVAGGWNGTDLDSVDILDLGTLQWSQGASIVGTHLTAH